MVQRLFSVDGKYFHQQKQAFPVSPPSAVPPSVLGRGCSWGLASSVGDEAEGPREKNALPFHCQKVTFG